MYNSAGQISQYTETLYARQCQFGLKDLSTEIKDDMKNGANLKMQITSAQIGSHADSSRVFVLLRQRKEVGYRVLLISLVDSMENDSRIAYLEMTRGWLVDDLVEGVGVGGEWVGVEGTYLAEKSWGEAWQRASSRMFSAAGRRCLSEAEADAAAERGSEDVADLCEGGSEELEGFV
ncbi:tRNA threonylcarbamoyl adenosine modification protein [Striga asiatica]|uniref:tRNA threonylcarbamoyl adenosine modification protein n=1 Tax=Striga asiatica TaxID=4170 RepID=A0A5A7QZV2_STRAF|nr:tRNA threonylcarbamoyl adenosine modification protein [Striga asiatica]